MRIRLVSTLLVSVLIASGAQSTSPQDQSDGSPCAVRDYYAVDPKYGVEVSTDFWEQARLELERGKPDIMLLAVASKPELFRSAFDIDYGGPLMSMLNKVLLNGEPASTVRLTIEQQQLLFPR